MCLWKLYAQSGDWNVGHMRRHLYPIPRPALHVCFSLATGLVAEPANHYESVPQSAHKLLRTHIRGSSAWLEHLSQHLIELELQPVWYRRQQQPLDKVLVQELGNAQQWTANS